MEVLGAPGYVKAGSPGAAVRGELEAAYRQAPVGTFGGGVNEVQREIIAMAGLQMPRAPR
jgi:alkylation response protein AidB-like acyl-CoA dehydrogenase